MTNRTRWVVGAFGLALAFASPAVAQSGSGASIEIGMDALLGRRSTTQTFANVSSSFDQTLIQVPLAQVRVGFALTPIVELEPAMSFVYSSTQGGHGSQLQFDVGLPINLQTDRSKPNWYVRPLIGFEHVSSTSTNITGSTVSSSGSQVSFGAGLGVRIPIDRRFATRFEANYRHGNGTDNVGSYNQFGILAGLSFFTR